MVKLTMKLVAQKTSKTNTSKVIDEVEVAKKKKEHYDSLKKFTHLHLQGSSIDEIGDISECRNLTVLYLQNNSLTRINNLHHSANLTHLYLQHNNISKIENLQTLTKLRKLYLGYNCIAVVEGLERLKNLYELHIEKQTLPAGESLYFDPRTVRTLAGCVRVLNITGNNLTTLSELATLNEVEHCVARDNSLGDLTEVATSISYWPRLVTLELSGNPICSQQKYRVKVIAAASFTLKTLDGKQVSAVTRVCMKKLERNRIEMGLKRSRGDFDELDPISSVNFSLNFNAPNMACLRQLTPGMLLELKRSLPAVSNAGLRVTSMFHRSVPQLSHDMADYQAWQTFNPRSNKSVLPAAYERQKQSLAAKHRSMGLMPFTDHLPTL